MKKYQLEVARYNSYTGEHQTVATKELEGHNQAEVHKQAREVAGNKEYKWFTAFFLVEDGQRVATVSKKF